MEGMTREEPDREPRPWATPGSGDQGPAPASIGPGPRGAPTEKRAAAASQPAAPHDPKRPRSFASSSRLPRSLLLTSPLLSIAQPPPAKAAVSVHAPTLAAAPPPPDALEVIYANEPPPEITRLDPENWNPFDPQEPAQEPDLPEDRSDVEEEPPDDDTTANLREAIEGAAAIESLDRIRVIRSPGDQSDDDDL